MERKKKPEDDAELSVLRNELKDALNAKNSMKAEDKADVTGAYQQALKALVLAKNRDYGGFFKLAGKAVDYLEASARHYGNSPAGDEKAKGIYEVVGRLESRSMEYMKQIKDPEKRAQIQAFIDRCESMLTGRPVYQKRASR